MAPEKPPDPPKVAPWEPPHHWKPLEDPPWAGDPYNPDPYYPNPYL